MSDSLTPLEVAINIFGTRARVEDIAGCKPKGSYAWGRPGGARRAGDLPPYVQRKLLGYARRNKVTLDPVWLITGATRTQIDTYSRVVAKLAAE